MFETSVVKARVVAQRRYGVLSASLAVHTIVIIAVVAFSLGSVSLPKNAPKELASFISLPVVPLPMPQGRRDAPHRENPPPQQHAAATPRAQTAPPENVTPARVPDSIPTIPTGSGDTTNANTNNVGDNERYGDPNGDPHVKDIGQETPGPAIPDVVYQPGLEVKSAVVLTRVQPQYPPVLVKMHVPGWVIVKCVVGKHGEIREPEVAGSSNALFEKPALDALRQWTFAPGSMRGSPVDTFFELKITFNIN